MHLRFFNVLAAFSVAAAVALPLSAAADDAADEAAINAIWNSSEAARVAGDADAWLSLWDGNGIQMPPATPARGKDLLMGGIPKALAAMPASAMEISPEKIVIMGDWASPMHHFLHATASGT